MLGLKMIPNNIIASDTDHPTITMQGVVTYIPAVLTPATGIKI